jgi:SAM-dependent methyltransferase
VSPSDYLTTTRDAYDAVAADYAQLVGTELTEATEGPVDRALLSAFAELVKSSGLGPVADVGCGPGRVAAYLASLGLAVVGVDLSPRMIEVAREAHPALRFEVGSLTALDRPDGALGGVVAWYSIIHTPPAHLSRVFEEFKRVLAPGGHVLLAFQAGENEHVQKGKAYGHAVSLDNYRHSIERVAGLLGEAGFVVHAHARREPMYGFEKTPQGYVLAHLT